MVRAWNCGLFTVMWRSDYSPELGHIKANCKYLVPGYLDVFTEGRIVDVGFLGKWWLTDKAGFAFVHTIPINYVLATFRLGPF